MFDVSKGTERARAWPRSRPTTRSKAQRAAEDKFYWAQMATKFMAPQILTSVRKAVAGTALLPRDLLTSQLYNRLCYFALEDGTPRYPMASIYQVSQSLDALGSTPGQVLVRGPTLWETQPWLPQPSGGALVKIGSFVATGGENAWSFTVPTTGLASLVIDFTLRCLGAGGTHGLNMRFNGDASTIYDWRQVFSSGAGSPSNQAQASVGQTAINAAFIVASGAPADTATSGEILIPDPNGTAFYQAATSTYGNRGSTVAAGLTNNQGAGWWRSKTAISQVNFTINTGLAAGSTMNLYGRQ